MLKDTFIKSLAGFWERNGKLVVSILLFPVAPLLAWGPITHLYLNKRALDRVTPADTHDDRVKLILENESLKNIFINAGNSVDLIKANNLRNRERYFEYAHNTIPNYFTGSPVMGQNLLQEIGKTGNDPQKLAWAFGWLGHQVCDGFAHKIPHAGCEGWVNSRRVLAGYYQPEADDESVSVARARIQLCMADHWLVEMLVDCLCYARERDFMDGFNIDLSVPTNGEVLSASTRILKDFEKQLGPGFVYFEPLSDAKLKSIVDFYNLLILGTMQVYRAILRTYSHDEFESFINSSPRMSRLDELLENSTAAIASMLRHPDQPWQPREWLPGGSNKFNYSVYQYERVWRPGRYKFGRKTGIMGVIYYSRFTEGMITSLRNIARSTDLWPFIRLAMGTMYNRGRNQWPISSTFIRTLISRKPPSIPRTMEQVALHCRLKKYPEIIPD